MRKPPEDAILEVEDIRSFLRFLKALSEDWDAECEIEEVKPSPPYGPGALGWENGTIGTFLDAAAACGMSQFENGIEPHPNPWRAAAEIVLAGKYYE